MCLNDSVRYILHASILMFYKCINTLETKITEVPYFIQSNRKFVLRKHSLDEFIESNSTCANIGRNERHS